MSSLNEQRRLALHARFIKASQEFPELRFLAVRNERPHSGWPIVVQQNGERTLGFRPGEFHKIIGNPPRTALSSICSLWLRVDGDVWQAVFFNGGDETDDLSSQFERLTKGTIQFTRLAEKAAWYFDVPKVPLHPIEPPVEVNFAHRWLEIVCEMPFTEREEIDGLRILRVPDDIFIASARAVEVYRPSGSQFEQPGASTLLARTASPTDLPVDSIPKRCEVSRASADEAHQKTPPPELWQTPQEYWETNPIDVFRMFRQRVIGAAEIAISIHEGGSSYSKQMLSEVLPYKHENLRSFCELASVLWGQTPIPDYLVGNSPSICLDGKEVTPAAVQGRAIIGSCVLEVLMQFAQECLERVDGEGTIDEYRDFVRREAGASDSGIRVIKRLISLARNESETGMKKWESEQKSTPIAAPGHNISTDSAASSAKSAEQLPFKLTEDLRDGIHSAIFWLTSIVRARRLRDFASLASNFNALEQDISAIRSSDLLPIDDGVRAVTGTRPREWIISLLGELESARTLAAAIRCSKDADVTEQWQRVQDCIQALAKRRDFLWHLASTHGAYRQSNDASTPTNDDDPNTAHSIISHFEQAIPPSTDTGVGRNAPGTSRSNKPLTKQASPMTSSRSDRSIVWLHLSDLHNCKKKTGWDAHRVLRPLMSDLRKMERDHGLIPQLLFFTGDAAYGNIGNVTGSTLKEQFDGANQLFEAVRTAFSTPVRTENVFIVPGNHDVDREEVTPDQTSWLATQTQRKAVNDIIQTAGKQWRRYMDRLTAYGDFLARHGYGHLLSDTKRLIYDASRELHGLKLGIAGFNSAWSCCQDGEKGKLWIGGDWQSGELVGKFSDADFRVALTHHPFGWFVEQEDTPLRILVEREFAFHLHGHEHLGWVDAKAEGHVSIAAAACYDRSQMENGYNFVRLNLETGEAEVWLRRYDSQGGGWVPRVVSGKTNNDGLWPLGKLAWLQPLVAKANSGNPK